jgi:hypothetical protein
MHPAAGALPPIAPMVARREPYKSRNTCWKDLQNLVKRSGSGLYSSLRSKPADSVDGFDDESIMP